MGFNSHPFTTVIEIAHIIGEETQQYQVIVGYSNTTEFLGCTDVGNNTITPEDNDKSFYSGDSWSQVEGVGDGNGCAITDEWPFWPGQNKALKMRMSSSSLVGTGQVTYYAEEVDTGEVYDWNDGFKTIKFTDLCVPNSFTGMITPADTYNLSNDIFTNNYGNNLKVRVNTDVYFNGVTAGPNNTNSLSVRLRLVRYRAGNGTTQYFYKSGSTAYSDGRNYYIGSANFNDKCAINCYVNTQNLGGFGVPGNNGYIDMDMGDTLKVQMLIGRDQPGFDDTDDSTKLCDGGTPSPPGLGLTQDPANCAIGMGTKTQYDLDFTNILNPGGQGSVPVFCDKEYNYKSGGFGMSISQPAVPQNDAVVSPCVPDGRTLYFKHQDPNTLSPLQTEEETIIFDILRVADWNDFDDLMLKGNGTDHMYDLAAVAPYWWNSMMGDPGIYNWYVSAYQHSGNWYTGGVGFSWTYSDEKKDKILSYEGEYSAHNCHEIYKDPGALGFRSEYLWDNGLDCYEVTISVSSLVDCRIVVHEGTASDPTLTATNPAPIDTTGVFTFCLSALQGAQKWGPCGGWQTNGNQNFSCSQDGAVLSDPSGSGNGQWFYFFGAGGIKILTAEKVGAVSNASCVIDYIHIRKMQKDIRTTASPVYGGNHTYETPIYEWDLLDVLDSQKVPLSLTFAIGDLKDITKRTAGFSKTFQLPASKNNEKILGSMLAVGSEKQNIEWKKARIRSNGIIVFNGLMRVEQGTTGKGGTYKCHIIEDTIDWSAAIGDKTLCEVDILQLDAQPKTRDEIVQSWSQHKPYHFDRAGAMGSGNKLAEDYFWGVASYGAWHRKSLGIDNKKDIYDFHPFVYTKRLVEKIFSQSGYTLESKFWESVTASLLCHPFTSGENYYSTDPNDLLGASGSMLGEANHPGGACQGNYQSGGKIPAGGYNRTWYPELTVASDWSNLITGTSANKFGGASNKGYVVPFTGNYSVTYKFTLHTSNASVSYGSKIEGFPLKNGQPFWPWTAGSYSSGAWTVHTQSLNFNLNAGDILSFRVVGENDSNTYPCWQDCEDMEFLCYPNTGTTAPAQLVEFSKVLDCGLKQIDYLKGLTDMFNLQWTANEEQKIVYCEPYDDFFGSGKKLDWTDKLDTKNWTDKYIIEELAKKVIFDYDQDSSDEGLASLQRWREGLGLEPYKSYFREHNEKFRKDIFEMGCDFFSKTWRFNNYGTQSNPGQHGASHPFAPLGFGWGDMAWTTPSNTNNPLMPVIWTDQGGQINGTSAHRPPYQEYPKADMRILNYYSLLNGRLIDESGNQADFSHTGCVDWQFYETDSVTYDYFPYSDWINGYKRNVGVDNYNLAWHDYDDGYGNISPGLFTKYWEVAYNKMNGGALLRTCKMHLTQEDIAGFDYRDLIVIKIDSVDTYWTVNKIKDYTPNKENLTTVELVEWKQRQDFAEGKNKPIQYKFGEITLEEDREITKGVSVNNSGTTTSTGGGIKTNGVGNVAENGGIAIGHGVEARSRQTVVGNYNNPNSRDVFQVGTGTSEYSRNTAFSVKSDGEVQIHGGALVVQEDDGIVHELVYDDEVVYQDEVGVETTETKVKKVYLKKENDKKIKESQENTTRKRGY